MAVERAPRRFVALRGAHINNQDAEILGPEIEAISVRDGGITPASIIERAQTPGTVLNAWDHAKGYFEWDDTKAARAHRETQARQLIKSIVIRVDTGEETLNTRAFYSIALDERARRYLPVEQLAGDSEYVQQVRDRFHNELIRIDRDYRAFLRFSEFSQSYRGVFEAIDAVVDDEEARPKRSTKRVTRAKVSAGR